MRGINEWVCQCVSVSGVELRGSVNEGERRERRGSRGRDGRRQRGWS